MTAVLVWVAVDLGQALAQPSQDSLVAKTAEWAWLRGFGDLVTWLEKIDYQLNPPPTGGAPSAGIPLEATPVGTTTNKVGGGACGSAAQPTPARQPPNVGAGQPIETVKKRTPVILAAFVRPHAQHSRFLAGVTCINQNLARFTLHAGTQVPGGSGWSQPSTFPTTQRGRLLATFNSGFLMADAIGGFWLNGQSVGHLIIGRASMVFSTNGQLGIRAWEGGNVPAEVAAIRQNLTLLVDNGQITNAVQHADSGAFGKTLDDSPCVGRSGIGIRADGTIVTVHGNALPVQTLALPRKNAGAVQLDITRDWTSFICYQQAPTLSPKKLTDDEVSSTTRYLETSTRDSVAVLAR